MEFKVLPIWHQLPDEVAESLNYYANLGWAFAGMGDHKIVLQRKKPENTQKQLNG